MLTKKQSAADLNLWRVSSCSVDLARGLPIDFNNLEFQKLSRL